MIRVAVVALIVALGAGLPIAPAIALDLQPSLPVRVMLIFDRDTYRADETTRLTVILTNHGADTLTGVTARCRGSESEPNLRGGAGWGALAEGGAGVTVPAGGAGPVSVAVAVSEPVPPAAPRFGLVVASCSFGADGYPDDVRSTAETTAQVPGVHGSGRGRIFQNLDNDGEIDDGEAVAGVPVVVTDPNTGMVVARPVTDERGGFVISNLPATVYSVRVAGPWKAQYDQLSWFRLPVVAGGPFGEPAFAVLPGSEQENNKPNLKVSATFGNAAYKSGDVVQVRIVVTNIGEVAAEGVRVFAGGRGVLLDHPVEAWGEFANESGVGIPAGAARVVDIEGTIREADVGAVVFSAEFVTANGEIDDTNNEVLIAAAVNATRGTYAGAVYGDRNNNAVMDPGEGLGHARIVLTGQGSFEQVTDANGRFAFRSIPIGQYNIDHFLPYGWVLPPALVVVIDETEHPDVLVRAVRPTSEVLTASVAFTRDTYAVGEAAHLTVTLTNNGSNELTQIKALCTGGRSAKEIISAHPGWGALAENGPGVAVRAGETTTFDVWSIVPEDAFVYGNVIAECYFGPMLELPGNTYARDVARVSGGFGTASGTLVYDRNSDTLFDGDGVPNTKVVLFDTDTGKVVARAMTDDSGRFVFKDIPAGPYEFRVIGPWRLIGDATLHIIVGADKGYYKTVVPGPLQPDPDARPEAEPEPGAEPAPQAAVAPAAESGPGGGGRLASTGATVIGLSVMGVAALVLGIVLVLFRRRGTEPR